MVTKMKTVFTGSNDMKMLEIICVVVILIVMFFAPRHNMDFQHTYELTDR